MSGHAYKRRTITAMQKTIDVLQNHHRRRQHKLVELHKPDVRLVELPKPDVKLVELPKPNAQPIELPKPNAQSIEFNVSGETHQVQPLECKCYSSTGHWAYCPLVEKCKGCFVLLLPMCARHKGTMTSHSSTCSEFLCRCKCKPRQTLLGMPC